MFIAFVIAFVVFVVAFIFFIFSVRKMTTETFKKLCQNKVKRFAKRNHLHAISDLHILNFQREKIGLNHVIFGNKYIYVISDFLLKGFVSGNSTDNSWVYYNNINKKTHYLSNLNMISDKNIREFAGILGISSDPIVSICLVPNECDFKIQGSKDDKKIIVHYSSLNRKIKSYEKQEIDSFDKTQILEQYQIIESKNNENRN